MTQNPNPDHIPQQFHSNQREHYASWKYLRIVDGPTLHVSGDTGQKRIKNSLKTKKPFATTALSYSSSDNA